MLVGGWWRRTLRRQSRPVPVTTSRLPLGRAHMLASTIMREAHRVGLGVASLTPVGSLRRFSPDIGDVALVGIAAPETHAEVLDAFARVPPVPHVLSRSASHVTTATDRGPVTLHVAAPEYAGVALVWHTGSRRHTGALQARARSRGLTLDGAQLRDAAGVPLSMPTEDALYRHLDLPFIPPELREGEDEIGAAEQGELPTLVGEPDIRGDLHMHSTWSDGRDSIEEMVYTSQQLGYEYVAITDHSERSQASRKMSGPDISKQRREIDKLRTRVQGVEILHGIEVDIMHDGSLDFDDEQLEAFDIVLASLHDHGGHSAK